MSSEDKGEVSTPLKQASVPGFGGSSRHGTSLDATARVNLHRAMEQLNLDGAADREASGIAHAIGATRSSPAAPHPPLRYSSGLVSAYPSTFATSYRHSAPHLLRPRSVSQTTKCRPTRYIGVSGTTARHDRAWFSEILEDCMIERILFLPHDNPGRFSVHLTFSSVHDATKARDILRGETLSANYVDHSGPGLGQARQTPRRLTIPHTRPSAARITSSSSSPNLTFPRPPADDAAFIQGIRSRISSGSSSSSTHSSTNANSSSSDDASIRALANVPSPLESVELEATSYFPQVPSIRSFGTVRRTSPRETFRVPLFDSPERRRRGSDVPPAGSTPSSAATRPKPDSPYPPRCPLPQLRTIPPRGSPAQSGSHETALAATTAFLDIRPSTSPIPSSKPTTSPPIQVRDFAPRAAPRTTSPHDSPISATARTTTQPDVQPSSPPRPTSSERILGPTTHHAPNPNPNPGSVELDQVFLRGGGVARAHHFRTVPPARRSTISTTAPAMLTETVPTLATVLRSAHTRRPRYVLTPQRAIDDERENSGAAEERAMMGELRETERALGIRGGAGVGGAAAGGQGASGADVGVMDETPPREGRFARIARGV